MKRKRELMDALMDERNFEIAEVVWQGLNEARLRYQEQFWTRIEKILRVESPRGWIVEAQEPPTSKSWYCVTLHPRVAGRIVSYLCVQQTTENERWRLQWGVGISTADGNKPRLPSRGLPARLLEDLKDTLKKDNFQPGRNTKSSWWVAKKNREEHLGDWSILRAIAANDELEHRIVADLLTLLSRTRSKILAFNRSVAKR